LHPQYILNDLAQPGGPDVLGYGAFDGICVLQNRAARLTQPTLDALEQGAQVLAPAHGTQQQDVFAEGGGD